MKNLLPWPLFLLALLALGGCEKTDPFRTPGYIEGEFVYVASPFGGRLETLSVQRGDTVAAGAPLFTLDDTPEEAALAEAERRVDQLRSSLADVRLGQRPSEIQTLQAQLEQARAALTLSDRELKRQSQLLTSSVAAKRDVDVARAQRDQDAQHVTQLEATLQTAQLGARDDQIKAAEHSLQAQEAVLAGAQWNLSQKKQLATQTALVDDILYRPGDWVAAGQPAVVLLPPENVKVRTFVSQEVLGRILVGRGAEIFVDGVAKPYDARVSFISPRAEYNPPVIYSQKMREKFVFLVELSVTPEVARQLHPGQPVDVRIQPE